MENQQEAKDFDSVADDLLNKVGTETQSDSSPENKPEEKTETEKTATAEVEKTEKVKEVEADSSLSVEDKIAKIKEILGEDEKALDAYIKAKGYHNDPAWQKQRDIIEKLKKEGAANAKLSAEDRTALEEFRTLRKSPEYIQSSMKAQGFTQEAIDKKLKESGFDVVSKPQDDVQLVVSKLGLKLDEMNPQEKASVLANISDIAKITDILFQDRMGKVLPKELDPLKQHLSKSEQEQSGVKMINSIREIVKTEGILDFDKDIDPALNKFLDENPDATQADVSEYFKSINHSLSLERLKTGKRKEERDDKRNTNRPNIPSGGSKTTSKKTGNFEQDADAFLETVDIA